MADKSLTYWLRCDVGCTGILDHLLVTVPQDGNTVDTFTVSVSAFDQYQNLAEVSTDGATVTASSDSNSVTTPSIVITDGFGRATFSLPKPGEYVYTLNPGTALQSFPTTVSRVQTVVPGPTERFVIQAAAAGTVDDPVQVIIQAVDAHDNINVNEGRTIRVETTGNATGVGIAQISSGVGQLFVSSRHPETVLLSLSSFSDPTVNVSDTTSVVFGPGTESRAQPARFGLDEPRALAQTIPPANAFALLPNH